MFLLNRKNGRRLLDSDGEEAFTCRRIYQAGQGARRDPEAVYERSIGASFRTFRNDPEARAVYEEHPAPARGIRNRAFRAVSKGQEDQAPAYGMEQTRTEAPRYGKGRA